MSGTSNNKERRAVLLRLRKRRARSRRDEVNVGVHLQQLQREGDITENEYNFVMGITDELSLEGEKSKKSKSQDEKSKL